MSGRYGEVWLSLLAEVGSLLAECMGINVYVYVYGEMR